MADPKKDTVRIALPTRPEQAAADPSAAKHDAARIVLPSRPPVTPIRRLPPKITPPPPAESIATAPSVALPRRPPVTPTAPSLLQPLPKLPGIEPRPDARIGPSPPVKDESATATSSANPGPKKETARIHSTGSVPVPIVVTSKPGAPVDAIPRSLAWGLLGVSAVIFLIQIWNYVVS